MLICYLQHNPENKIYFRKNKFNLHYIYSHKSSLKCHALLFTLYKKSIYSKCNGLVRFGLHNLNLLSENSYNNYKCTLLCFVFSVY